MGPFITLYEGKRARAELQFLAGYSYADFVELG
jgi:hypothetical protein